VGDEEPTEQQPVDRPDETVRIPAADETAPQPRADDGTAILPRSAEPDDAARWSARAGVPTGPRRPAPAQQWVPEEAGPSRTWWLPILIGLMVLILVGLIGLGLWLALRGSNPGPSPSPTPSAAPTTASPSPSASPTASPSPSAVLIPVPTVTNLSVSDALPILQGQGLVPRVVTEVNETVPAGTVIRTEPAAGTPVPVGSTVVVRVATAPPSSAPPSSASPKPSASGQ
jgi:cytoskeletal protein RodZ